MILPRHVRSGRTPVSPWAPPSEARKPEMTSSKIKSAPREEQMMCEFFGDDYRDYMRRTGRLFPRWREKGAA